MLITDEKNYWIYGRAADGGTQLNRIDSDDGQLYQGFFREIEVKKVGDKNLEELGNETLQYIHYQAINNEYGHFPKKTGSTKKITEYLHAIDIQHAEVRAVQEQDSYYTAALFTGTESLFYPATSMITNEPNLSELSDSSPNAASIALAL